MSSSRDNRKIIAYESSWFLLKKKKKYFQQNKFHKLTKIINLKNFATISKRKPLFFPPPNI